MAEREFDPGLDTPTAYQPGAGFPVPGSPVWQDAERRKQVQEEERKAEIESATNWARAEEGGQPATNPTTPADEGKIDAKLAEVDTDVADKTADEQKAAARATRADKAAAPKAKGDK